MQRTRTGMTLIEVLGALVILSTLLVGILTAKGRLVRQLVLAQQKAQAVQAADLLLTTWWQDPTRFPRAAQGRVDGSDGFSWRTQIVSNDQVKALGGQLVCLEIFDAKSRPLASVHIVLSAPAERTEP